MPATLKLTHKAIGVEVRRDPYDIVLDGQAVGQVHWAHTPWASQSPFNPYANAAAAAWLYSRDGPNQWVCK